jgi:hypothetical protein
MGSYPSFEDLTIATKTKNTKFSSYINVIVTPDHTWVLLSPKIYKSEYELLLKQNYDIFHNACEWWRAQKDKKALKNEYVKFAAFMTKINYPIRVVDNTNVNAIMLAIRHMQYSSSFTNETNRA